PYDSWGGVRSGGDDAEQGAIGRGGFIGACRTQPGRVADVPADELVGPIAITVREQIEQLVVLLGRLHQTAAVGQGTECAQAGLPAKLGGRLHQASVARVGHAAGGEVGLAGEVGWWPPPAAGGRGGLQGGGGGSGLGGGGGPDALAGGGGRCGRASFWAGLGPPGHMPGDRVHGRALEELSDLCL